MGEKMNEDFLFSIIMLVYNTEKYIEKSLQSVYEAIDTDCEVIIVNDGSKDDSEKIILKFLENLPEKFKDNFIINFLKTGSDYTLNKMDNYSNVYVIEVYNGDMLSTGNINSIGKKYLKEDNNKIDLLDFI